MIEEFKQILKDHLEENLKNKDYEGAKQVIELVKCLDSGYQPVVVYSTYPTYPTSPYNPWDVYTVCSSESINEVN